MADEDNTISLDDYARSRGVARRSIQLQVEKGVIQMRDGKLDPSQADASWGVVRRASKMGQYQRNEDGERSAKAKVAVTLAKLRLVKQRLDTVRSKYVDRAEAISVAESEADFVIGELVDSPSGYADTLAEELGIKPTQALAVLTRFVSLTVAEIGDLKRQAVRDAERA